MLKALGFQWPRKARAAAPVDGDVPKSFITGDRELFKVSMEERQGDFIDIDYRKLSYAEAAALLKNQQLVWRVATVATVLAPAAAPRRHEVSVKVAKMNDPDDEIIYEEKIKTNNYFLKNKVYKKADRNPRRKAC